MGLASLDAALSGLRVSQQQINVISTNISNVGTAGYSRKILPQAAQSVGGTTVGVLSQTVIRNVDINLERDLWTQVSAAGALDVKQTYLSKVDQFHGPPDKELSFAAELSHLKDSFSSLSDNPQDPLLLAGVVNQASDTAGKINDLSKLVSTLRNDSQTELKATVDRANDLLGQIADANNQIRGGFNANRSVASAQDTRSAAIKELSQLIDISSFQRGDGVLVVQTNQGVELASDKVTGLSFTPAPLSNQSYYPASAAALYVGNPATGNVSDITSRSPGGKIGGLLELRDVTFPKQTAQIDEVAEKLATRMSAQGLKLFTDASGNIPSDAPPNLTTNPPTPVAYVGFASQIRVNSNIISNNKLLQQGTYGATVPTSSNEVIRRAIEFGFGDVNYQSATGKIDLGSISSNTAPNDTLQNFLGIKSQNTVMGTRDLSAFAAPADFAAAAGATLGAGSDTFRFTFEEPDLGLGPVNVDFSLGSVPNTGGNMAQDIISYITNTVIPGLPSASQTALTAMGVQFTEGPNGQLSVNSNANITTDATTVANGAGQAGLSLLGFSQKTTEATDPYFDVKIGNKDAVRITIGPSDDQNDLLAKLRAVPGLAVEDFTTSADGYLRIRPGNNYANPDFGGDLKILAGAFTSSGAGANTVVGAGTIPNGVNIITALFGSFTTSPLQESAPVTSTGYSSKVDSSVGSGSTAFRTSYLGPGANISTGVTGATGLVDFAQKIISQQSQELTLTQNRFSDEDTLRQTLDRQMSDDSGVNLDEELGNLVVVQSAYAAAARVINAVNDLFEELLSAVR